ncbi:Ig-like domain-containing protein, partial [Escherichia coli]|uniref:Ig-like domain-containing protein n=1 Tax=Escherichia coli TaxID=562 RepID=UPI003FA5469B
IGQNASQVTRTEITEFDDEDTTVIQSQRVGPITAETQADVTPPTAAMTAVTDDVGSVTGALTSGDATDDTSLVLSGTAEAGSTVAIYNGTTKVGDATVTGTTWTYTAAIADGTTYEFNAKETDKAGNE